MKRLFLLFASILSMVAVSYATEVTLTMSSYNWANAAKITSIEADAFVVSLAKGTGTDPAYYTSDATLRIYKGNTFKITPKTGYKLVKASYLVGASSTNMTVSEDGSSASISPTATIKIKSITVEYEAISSPTECGVCDWNVKDGDTVYPGDEIIATCPTSNTTVTIKNNYSDTDCVVGDTDGCSATWTVTEDMIGQTLKLSAHALSSLEDIASSESNQITLHVEAKPEQPDTPTDGMNDTIDKDFFNISGTTYTLYKKESDDTKVVYYAKANLNNTLQINYATTGNNQYSGVISQSNPNGLVIEKIVVTKNGGNGTPVMKMSNTPGTVTGDVGGTGTAVLVQSPSDAKTITGVKSENAASKDVYTYTPADEYQYFALTTSSGAVQVLSIEVTYQSQDPNKLARPTAALGDNEVAAGSSVNAKVDDSLTLSAAEGATVMYTITKDGETAAEPVAYSAPISLNEAGKFAVVAYAAQEGKTDSKTLEITIDVAKYTNTLKFEKTAISHDITSEDAVENALTNPNSLSVIWDSSDKNVATVDDNGSVTILAAGSTVISAKTEADRKYEEGNAQYTLTVNRVAAGVSISPETCDATLGEDFDAPVVENPNNMALTWSSSNENVATVNKDGIVTLVGGGKTDITASWEQTPIYNAGSVKYTLNVTDPNALKIVFKSSTSYNSTSRTTKNIADEIEEGKDLIGSYDTVSSVFQDTKGVRFGSSNNDGDLKFTLAKTYNVTSVIINASQYGSDACKISLNGADAQTVKGDFNDYIFPINGSLTSLEIKSTNRVNVKTITLNVNTSAVPEIPTCSTPVAYVGDMLLEDGATITTTTGIRLSEPQDEEEINYNYEGDGEYYPYSVGDLLTLPAGEWSLKVKVSGYGSKKDYAPVEKTWKLNVELTDPDIHFVEKEATYYLDETPSIPMPEVTNISDKIVTFTSSDTDVAEISNDHSTINLKKEGVAIITVSYRGSEDIYKDASDTFVLSVVAAKPQIRRYSHSFDFNKEGHYGKDVCNGETQKVFELPESIMLEAPLSLTVKSEGNVHLYENTDGTTDLRLNQGAEIVIAVPDNMYIKAVVLHRYKDGNPTTLKLDGTEGVYNTANQDDKTLSWEIEYRTNSASIVNEGNVWSISAIDVVFDGPVVAAPVFDAIEDDKQHISYKVQPGHELHMQHRICHVYGPGNVEVVNDWRPFVAGDDFSDSPEEAEAMRSYAPRRVSETTDEPFDLSAAWQAPVADHQSGEAYVVNLPSLNDGDVYQIMAKALDNGIHSDEDTQMVGANGDIVTAIDLIYIGSDTVPAYFNLQGIRVDEPQKGEVYIVVKGGRSSRVVF